MAPTSKGRKGVDGNEGNGRMSERGEGQGKGRANGRGEEGRRGERICRTNVTLLPTHPICSSAIFKVIYGISKCQNLARETKFTTIQKINTIRLLNEISTDIFLHFHLKTQYGTFFSNRK